MGGTYYFSCTYNGHCENGQKLMLQVTAAPTKNIVQLALGSTDLSLVVTALKAGNLVGALQGKGKLTCALPKYKGDGNCDDENNNKDCAYDGGDCCAKSVKGGQVKKNYCKECKCVDP